MYQNPVFDRPFADPFVLKHRGIYWGYATGLQADGRCFGIARSPDLVHWEWIGSALDPLPANWPCYWAPEVLYDNGRFLLYYSVGNEEQMHLRVAQAADPAGPFLDSGKQLTSEPFAIDAHVFTDNDGTRWMFYATDFLEHSHIGTGTVRDRMLDLFTLEGKPQPVTRARYNWQVYDPQRISKGGVRWHTVEGPFVLLHKGRYYQMFSGGNWQNPSYGVSYALAEHPDQPDEWRQVADGEQVLPVLRSISGVVHGPGHNSVVRGPDNRQLFCVYHRWAADGSERLLSIDPLDWAGERLLVLGPSTTPQPDPLRASLSDFFEQDNKNGPGPDWHVQGGRWESGSATARQLAEDQGSASATRSVPVAFLAEITLRALGPTPAGAYGLALDAAAGRIEIVLEPEQRRLALLPPDGAAAYLALPVDTDFRTEQLLRVEVTGYQVLASLDGRAAISVPWSGTTQLALFTRNCSAAFAGLELTAGWEDRFEQAGLAPAELGWQGSSGWHIEAGALWSPDTPGEQVLLKDPALALTAYELVVSARLLAEQTTGAIGIFPAARAGQPGPRLTIEHGSTGFKLLWQSGSDEQRLALPTAFALHEHQQLRLRYQAGRLSIAWEATALAEFALAQGPASIGLYTRNAQASFELLRVTALAH